ncbi:acyl-CoA synthetase FdrA [Halanaerobium sp. ST460_2HS_T2]|uniref:acyl-CoA synthetase FdrA n=1 Tax=Halanaerobium sp. ST460_2HS_T2 TaxID=2183914 RepID=UPI000DF2FF51|nr:acyl-CoA synthetase FdrA [Halanaerobium sp. ST460_2HS_T2]RCW62476.1 succinyl-CoA synthetase alpha subunit [Halanaerobium sp. ST460_2HS_T2]
MYSKTLIKKDSYYDSVTLMSLSNKILEIDGVEDAVVSMGTAMNKDLLNNIEMATAESEAAEENDLIIAIKAEDEAKYKAALEKAEELLANKEDKEGEKKEVKAKTINSALKEFPEANLAVISVPGQYAAREAKIALNKGLNVMLFSDNVSVEAENELKIMAAEKGLLLMGPDCGTAAINNKGLCFANKVKKGNISLAAASGTGLQEVMVQIDKLGGGVAQAIGTGGRDLKKDIGGKMMIQSIKALARDSQTEVITLISKPPAKEVEAKILDILAEVDKKVVICFLESERESDDSKIVFANTLKEAALKSVKAAGITVEKGAEADEKLKNEIKAAKSKLTQEQKYLRGLFGGGTLCAEALYILRDKVGQIKSNIAKNAEEKLDDINNYQGNVLLDMGEDEFTVGKPHPMIEPSLRNERIIREAEDPEVGVILLDIELGFGSHSDPAGVTVKAIKEAKENAAGKNRKLIFVGYICGTESDYQNYSQQAKKLREVGVILADNNVQAAEIAAEILA